MRPERCREKHARKRTCDEIKMHGNFIFVSVKGDYKIVEEGFLCLNWKNFCRK